MEAGWAVRPPALRLQVDDLIVDNFAGGGGASLGMRWALGRDPDIAVNHDPEAIAMHAANHPNTLHVTGDVWDVNPTELCAGRRVAVAWFSPDCTHHSKARGGKPFRDPKSATGRRGLAWVVIRWAKAVHPRVICLENVEEWVSWGPLTPEGNICPDRKGLTFRRWLGTLKNAGYHVEWRELRACDYGAPTTRKRLFVIARCDGLPIVWPTPTHGPGTAHPYRTAAECVDWSIACRSIFERPKPLTSNTLKRIVRGIQKFVFDAADPFVVPGTNIAPSLIQTGYGEREGQLPRVLDLSKPLGTVVAGGQKHGLVHAFLAKHFGGHGTPGSSLRRPMDTVTCRDHHALVEVATGAGAVARVREFLAKYNGAQAVEQPSLFGGPVRRQGLVNVGGESYEIVDIGMRMLEARELFRAQGFPDSYEIAPLIDGIPITKTAQIRMCGNSVSPVMARALVAANVGVDEVVAA